MNITKMIKKPKVFERLIGLSPEKFTQTVEELDPLWRKAEYLRKISYARKIGIGGGAHYKLSFEQMVAMYFMYLRMYPSHILLGMIFNIDDSRVCRYFSRLKPLLTKHMKPKRIIIKRINISEEEILKLIADATEQETEKRNGSGYSGKKKKQTIKTQVIVDTKGKVRHVSKSIAGNIHDKKLYDQTNIVLPNGSLADLGYLGTGLHIPHKSSKYHPLTRKQKKENQEHSKERIVVEHVFASLKQFRILSQRFRNRLSSYNDIFKMVAGIYNLRRV